MKKSMLLSLLALGAINTMTAPETGIIDPELATGNTGAGEAAGDVTTEAINQTMVDTTEGNRGPSNTTRNNGDPTAVIMGNPGEEVFDEADGNQIPNSTNAVTDLARARLTPTQEVTVDLGEPVRADYEVPGVFHNLLGTNNIERGPMNSAFRSSVYKWKEDSGQRAIIVNKDGTVHLLGHGTDYATAYARAHKEGVAFFAIAYFKQNVEADNPFVSIRWYMRDEMPVPSRNSVTF